MRNQLQTIQRVPLAILLLTAVLLAGATPAHAGHCKGKHINNPGCPGDNDPGTEFAVKVTYDCPLSSNNRECPDIANQHRMQADRNQPADPLTNGQEDVKAIVRDSGILQFGTAAKGQKPGERSIYWDFREGGTSSGFLRTSGELIATTDDVDGSHLTQIQVGRGANNSLDFRTLNFNNPDEDTHTQKTNLWANIAIVPDSGPKEWYFLRFEAADAEDQCPAASDTSMVTVTLIQESPRIWQIVGDASATACEQSTGQDLMLGPFRFEVEEL